MTVKLVGIAGIPLYDADLEAEHGIPEPVARLKDAIAAHGKLVDAAVRENLAKFLAGFVDYARR